MLFTSLGYEQKILEPMGYVLGLDTTKNRISSYFINIHLRKISVVWSLDNQHFTHVQLIFEIWSSHSDFKDTGIWCWEVWLIW